MSLTSSAPPPPSFVSGQQYQSTPLGAFLLALPPSAPCVICACVNKYLVAKNGSSARHPWVHFHLLTFAPSTPQPAQPRPSPCISVCKCMDFTIPLSPHSLSCRQAASDCGSGRDLQPKVNSLLNPSAFASDGMRACLRACVPALP